MRRDYWVDWLTAGHAKQAAKLERKVYPPDYCAGYHSIRGDLRDAEAGGRNLSMGLFLGSELVGFLLAFHETQRSAICEYIDVPPPAGIDLSGPGIYLNDFVVHPDHRGAGAMLAVRLTQVVRTRDDLRELPLDTFSTSTMKDTWSAKERFLRRMSIEVSERAELKAQAHGEELFWIVFRHVQPKPKQAPSLASRLKQRSTLTHEGQSFDIGIYTSLIDWALLRPFWNDLLARTPAGTVFQSYEYLTTWSSLLGLPNELLIVVVLRDDVPVAIAPMQVSRAKSLGRDLRCLGFIGHPSEVDRNTILFDPVVAPLIDGIADYLVSCGELWDFAALYEQPPGSPLVKTLAKLLQAKQYIVTRVPGPECATVSIAGSWNEFLASKPKSFRKSVNRRLSKIAGLPDAAFDSLPSPTADQAEFALNRYRAIEAASWKREAALGTAKSASHRSFFTQIVRTFAATGDSTFQFLRIGGKDASGTFGLRWAQTFYSLQIAHDESFADHSPGVTLTALELKANFENRRCATFDFLGGFMTNKRSWATSVLPTEALFVHRRNLNGWLFHWIHFRMRPHVRRALVRFKLLDVTLSLKSHLKKLRTR
jgi:CelD/BcsL family acetyltransferase involved in cellulose biosynthesis/GNAT superfamily N-acetyltransferase